MTKTVFVLNGPNLNLLGTREPDIYGSTTLAEIETALKKQAGTLSIAIEFRQSNHEGTLVDWIQECGRDGQGLIINGGAYSHTSIAILDALMALSVPIVEVHLSNLFKRETFRHHSYVSERADGMICGLGAEGYGLALQAIASRLETKE